MSNINEKKKYHFIYKTTNLINQKFYIGMHSTSNLKDGYLGSGKYLRNSIKKYGIENFKIEILEYCENRKKLVDREREIINEELINDSSCMNLKLGGNGGGFTKNDIAKGCIAATKKLKILHTNEEWKSSWKEKISKSLKGKPKTFKHTHSLETKLLMSINRRGTGIGINNSQFGTRWINKNNVNKKIKSTELESYLNNGWILGRKFA